ncbi:MAG: DivIVA domain-containing protein [Acidobacteria bacterium]|nr:MAG: DivIVA domain-containing protein [Acidobacteriota bacterium]
MEISPLELTQREFGRKFRGFDPDEVQGYLEQVAEEMTRLGQENADRAAQLQRLEGQLHAHEEREETLKATLLSAQKLTDEMKVQAQREAELLLKEAELKAERLLDQAQRKLGQVLAETAEAKRQRDLFVGKLRGLLKTHLELLDAAPDAPPEPQA